MGNPTMDLHPAAADALGYIAAQIRIERTARRLTQARLAHMVRCSPNTIRALEAGSPGCAVGTVFACCTVLGIPLLYEEAEYVRTRRREGDTIVSLLPRRVQPMVIDDDF